MFYYLNVPNVENLISWTILGPAARHGICHGHMDIISKKLLFTGVKFSFEHMLFVVNLLLIVLLYWFGIFTESPGTGDLVRY